MPQITPVSQRLSTLFLDHPCWRIAPLAAELGYSIPSVRRFLAEIGYLSSFTHNGAWYTLGSIPRFDTDGLWYYSDIGFSCAGSLTNTLVELTTRSVAGLSAEQLGAKLRCRCHSVRVQLCRQGRLSRQKLGSAYVYFAPDPVIASLQRQAVESRWVQLPAEIVVLILAEFIRSPECSFEQLAQAISRQTAVTIQAAQIERLFEQHGLKKKIPTSQPTP
jgi:hypothetical protein